MSQYLCRALSLQRPSPISVILAFVVTTLATGLTWLIRSGSGAGRWLGHGSRGANSRLSCSLPPCCHCSGRTGTFGFDARDFTRESFVLRRSGHSLRKLQLGAPEMMERCKCRRAKEPDQGRQCQARVKATAGWQQGQRIGQSPTQVSFRPPPCTYTA